MPSGKNIIINIKQNEDIAILSELRYLFMLAEQGGCRDLDKKVPNLCKIKSNLDCSHNAH